LPSTPSEFLFVFELGLNFGTLVIYFQFPLSPAFIPFDFSLATPIFLEMRSTLILAVIFAFCSSSLAAPLDSKSPYILEDKHTVPYSQHDSKPLLSPNHHYTAKQAEAHGSYVSPQQHSRPLGDDIYTKDMVETSHVPSKGYVKRTFIAHVPQDDSYGSHHRATYAEGHEPYHPSQSHEDSSPVDHKPHPYNSYQNHDHYDQTDSRNLRTRTLIGVDAGLSAAGFADVHGLDNYAHHYNKRSVTPDEVGTGNGNGHDFTKRSYGPVFGAGGVGIGAGVQVGHGVIGTGDANGHDYKKRTYGPIVGAGGFGIGGGAAVGGRGSYGVGNGGY